MTTAACSARFAFSPRLADADDRSEARLQRGFRLGADELVGLVMMCATLGMSDDDIGRARVLEHGRGNVAGERAACLGMAVLRAKPSLPPLSFHAACARRVAGGQTTSSAAPASPASAARRIASISTSDPESPFIFQLPATNGRTSGVIEAS